MYPGCVYSVFDGAEDKEGNFSSVFVICVSTSRMFLEVL